MSDHPFTKEEFDEIYSKVPRLTVEIIVKNDDGAVYMTKRAIEPCAGQWHLPGGTVYFAESLSGAVIRVASRELGIIPVEIQPMGFIEYPSHYEKGLDTPVGIVFEVTEYDGKVAPNQEATEGDWFTKVPENIHADQDKFLIANKYLEKYP